MPTIATRFAAAATRCASPAPLVKHIAGSCEYHEEPTVGRTTRGTISRMNPTPPPGPAHDDSETADVEPSLWRELADGSAGPAVKAFVSVALAPLCTGLALVACFALAGIVPSWSRRHGPDEELLLAMLFIGALLYVLAVAWIWTRRNRRTLGPLWRAGLQTVLIGVATLVIGVALEAHYGSPAEILIVAAVFLGIAGVVLVWVQGARRFARPQSLTNRADGVLDIRCPACHYRMVGLHESRCPECGTAYTLDELLGRQDFLTPAHRRLSSVVSAPPMRPIPEEPQSADAGQGCPVVTS